MKKLVFTLLMTILCSITQAQESQTEYNFLRLPISAHAAALGGNNISIIEDDPALMFSNPALAASVSDMTIGLSYMKWETCNRMIRKLLLLKLAKHLF